MKYFIDTEFIEDFREPIFTKRHHFIDLISIGIVAEDGRTYYAVSKEFNPDEASEWVKENVLYPIMQEHGFTKPLSNLHGCLSYRKNAIKHIQKNQGKDLHTIANEIYQFICPYDRASEYAGVGGIDEGAEAFLKTNPPSFYGYYADYDWIVFCKLFGTMMDLPKGFPMYCRDLKQMLDEKVECLFSSRKFGDGRDDFEWQLNYTKKSDKYPKQSNEHNALSDAKWNKQLYEFIVQI